MPHTASMRAPLARKGTRMFRRGMVVVVCVLVAVSATATAALAHERSEQTVIRSRDFTIARGQCTALPADLEIKGLGLERFTTVAEGARDGERRGDADDETAVSYSLGSRITGTATDSMGGQYRFLYKLTLRKPVILPGPGIITDAFTLSGTGQADGMSTFFRARVMFDSGGNPIAFELLDQTGDPFHCDPL